MPWSYAKVDWAATGAWFQGWVATGALWFLVVQVTRDVRARRRRDDALLTAALRPVVTLVQALDRLDLGKMSAVEAGTLLTRLKIVDTHSHELDRIDVGDLPDRRAVLAVMEARMIMRLSAMHIEQMTAGLRERAEFPEFYVNALVTCQTDLLKSVRDLGRSLRGPERALFRRD